MGIVRISSELGLSFDPLKGTVAEERDDVIQYALDPIIPMVDRLDHIADDLMNQLVPDNELMESYANRGKASYIGGLYTNIWMGFIIGLVVAFVLLISTLFTSEEGLNIIKAAMGGA
ncbi:MAG: tetrahydromethanopterin S-methyltransferase subunit B [Methanothrix sp.]|jgi:tetrahydromethanopterin S-methyltransferase subunit B